VNQNQNELLKRKLKVLRNKNQLTLEELASEIGMSYMSLSRFETGKRIPSDKTLKKIANFYDIPVSYFLEQDYFTYDNYGVNIIKLNSVYDDSILAFPTGIDDKYNTYRLKFSGTKNEYLHIYQEIGEYSLTGIGHQFLNLDQKNVMDLILEIYEKARVIYDKITSVIIYTSINNSQEIETIIFDNTINEEQILKDFSGNIDSSNIIFGNNDTIFLNTFIENTFNKVITLDYGVLDYNYLKKLYCNKH